MIDDEKIFNFSDSVKNYEIEPNNDINEQAIEVYNNLKQEN